MTGTQPRKSFADYAAIAVCPVLIMLVVGSLIFFLLVIGYSGSHLGELRWTFFWFVMAMVLVSRIAIERSSEHAWVYGLCLAAATAFMVLRFVDFNLWMWGLLALIWWATNKLAWDCTVIDDDQDASGEGLLQAAKLDSTKHDKGMLPAEREAREPNRKTPLKKPAKTPWWERGLSKPALKKQPHAPGLWVIYFSLGALPIFGFGQGMVAMQDVDGHQYAFYLLLIYVGAALGLLLITSFLGLRRYLRQRRLEMPAAMARAWLSTGAVLGGAILLGCLLVPRPNATWSLASAIDRLGDPVAKRGSERSKSSQLPEQLPSGESKPEGKKSAASDTEPASAAAAGKSDPDPPHQKMEMARGEGQNATDSAPAGGKNGPKKLGPTGPKGERAPQAKGAQPSSPERRRETPLQPIPTPRAQTWRTLLKLAIYAALIALGLFVIIKYRDGLSRLLLDFWQGLAEFWRNLLGRKVKTSVGSEAASITKSRQSFAAFRNPFASGAAAQMTPEDLVVHTFRGLEAWAEEHKYGRQQDQTPFEFADNLSIEVPELAHEAQELANLYAQVAYAKSSALPACRTILEVLWSKMTASAR